MANATATMTMMGNNLPVLGNYPDQQAKRSGNGQKDPEISPAPPLSNPVEHQQSTNYYQGQREKGLIKCWLLPKTRSVTAAVE